MPRPPSLKPIKIPTKDLRPMDGNPRAPIEEAMAGLRDSLETYGMHDGAPCAVQPIVVNRHPGAAGQIISGHRRWEAVTELGYSHVWAIPVSLPEEEAKELAVRLNVPAGDWDWELLLPHAQDLPGWGFTSLELPAPDVGHAELPFELPAIPDPTLRAPATPAEPEEFAPGMTSEEREAAWAGMPAFDQQDLRPHSQVIVSFTSEEDRAAFAELIGQELRPTTRSIWHPRQEWVRVAGVVEFADDAAAEDEQAA